MARQTIVAGNWKMHGNHLANQRLLGAIEAQLGSEIRTKVMVFPPFVYLAQVGKIISDSNSDIEFGAQNISEHNSGAFTGETSAAMLKDLGCTHVLVGHSERRSLYHESSQLITSKFVTAL